jgi:DNA excision repair protein ERCC-2
MSDTTVSDVEDIFPYNSYRSGQKDGISDVLDTVSDDGYLVVEGACGTGKTLMALTPLTEMVRSESSEIERILVVTSVKQQQKVFQEEIQEINDRLTEMNRDPMFALTLVGKQDVCPYVQQDTIDSYDIQHECSRLRENTRNIASESESSSAGAKDLADDVKLNSENTVITSEGGFKYPFDETIPTTGNTEYCPFYAEYIGRKYELMAEEEDPADVIPTKLTEMGLVDSTDLLQQAGKRGMCPHSIMHDSIEEAELIIANYKHIFHEPTVEAMTEDILDDSTAIVIDEGHNVVPKVRDELSQSVTLDSMQTAIREAREVYEFGGLTVEELDTLRSKTDRSEEEEQQLERIRNFTNSTTLVESESELPDLVRQMDKLTSSLDFEELESYISFLQDVEGVVEKVAGEFIEDELGDRWLQTDKRYDFSTGLRPDPSEPSQDRISQWMDLSGNRSWFQKARELGSSIESIREEVVSNLSDGERTIQPTSESLGEFLADWAKKDNTQYFREFQFEERGYTPSQTVYQIGWQNEYSLDLQIRNCIPREEIADVFKTLGGGVIMSATLEPIDIFVEESGLSLLEEDADIPINTNVFGLSFPEENRCSLTVDSTKFKYNEKGDRQDVHGLPNVSNPVREEYKDILVQAIDNSSGNVLVSMPSYPEAEWAAGVLDRYSSVSESAGTLLVDESSENWKTESLKTEFFKGDDKVLVTGTRGTLTEGVDYEGDKLAGVIVGGVPIENTQSEYKQAIKAAYVDEFGRSKGFDYAFTVPAVRKARQAIGRVIRGETEVGFRILADERYCKSNSEWDSVHEYLASYEKDEFEDIGVKEIDDRLMEFWNSVE